MAENENVLGAKDPDQKPVSPKSGNSKVKEWFRKKTVALKRKPQMIPLVLMLITTVYFMLVLFIVSQAISKSFSSPVAQSTGICTFITTLLSLLYLVSFLNAFPKRKKPNIFFIVLVGVMIAAMIVCDIMVYIQFGNFLADKDPADYQMVVKARPYLIAHVVLLGVSALVFALLPVYKRLINKINTKVELESATENMKGEIDIQED